MLFKLSEIFLLNTSPEIFYSILTQYENYPQFFSQEKILKKDLKSVSVKTLQPNIKEVTYTVNPFWTLTYTYTLILTEDPIKKEIHWHLSPHHLNQLFTSNKGSWKIVQENNQVKGFYEAEMIFQEGLPGFILKKEMKTAQTIKMPLMVQSFTREAKKLEESLKQKNVSLKTQQVAQKKK